EEFVSRNHRQSPRLRWLRHATRVALTLVIACKSDQRVTGPPPGVPTLSSTATTPAEVLVGAGNIANCGAVNDEATAALLDNMAGTVYTTGDNIYGSGGLSDFTSCYDPSWGRHKA